MTNAPEGMNIIHISHEELIYFSTCLFTISVLIYCKWYEVNWYDFINVIICMHITLCVSLNTCVRCAAERMPFPYPCPCSTANTHSLAHMMTSSNGNIFRVTGPLCGISPHKGQWRGALMFSLICAWINDWVNNREAGDLRRHRCHYDVNVMR